MRILEFILDKLGFIDEGDDELDFGIGMQPEEETDIADMAEAIKEDRDPYVTAQDGRDALETVLAVYLSSKTGQPVTLPLADVSTLDIAGLFD